MSGPVTLLNDSSRIWYLYKNRHHDYDWVDSKNAEVPPFALEFGKDKIGSSLLIGRAKLANGFIAVGTVVPFAGFMFYADETGKSKRVFSNYQVLTCKSWIKSKKFHTFRIFIKFCFYLDEKKYPTPFFAFPPNVDSDTGCGK